MLYCRHYSSSARETPPDWKRKQDRYIYISKQEPVFTRLCLSLSFMTNKILNLSLYIYVYYYIGNVVPYIRQNSQLAEET